MSKKILVIDDDNDILDIVTYILENKGYDVLTSKTSTLPSRQEVMQQDLILLDPWLSAKSGIDLCKQLKADSNLRYIPIILYSTIFNLKELANECDADRYIEKPFDIDDFEKAVSKLLGR